MIHLRSFTLSIALGLSMMLGAMQTAQADNAQLIRVDAVRAFAGIVLAVDAQSDFGAARARDDTAAARQAAADMLLGLAAAKFWLTVLDKEVDGSAYSAQIDSDVKALLDLVSGAFDRIDDLLFADDLDGIEAALDASGDAFTGLQRDGRAVLTALFPEAR